MPTTMPVDDLFSADIAYLSLIDRQRRLPERPLNREPTIRQGKPKPVSRGAFYRALFDVPLPVCRQSIERQAFAARKAVIVQALQFYSASMVNHAGLADLAPYAPTSAGQCAALISRILHHPVIHLPEPQCNDVERVVLVQPPRPLRSLLGQFRDRALHIA